MAAQTRDIPVILSGKISHRHRPLQLHSHGSRHISQRQHRVGPHHDLRWGVGGRAGYSQQAAPSHPLISSSISLLNVQMVPLLFPFHLFTPYTCTLRWLPLQEGHTEGGRLGGLLCLCCCVTRRASRLLGVYSPPCGMAVGVAVDIFPIPPHLPPRTGGALCV